MENNKYGIDYIYEKYGKVAIDKEILADQAGYWKGCYEALKKETDEKIGELEKAAKEGKDAGDMWFKLWVERGTEMKKLEETIASLEEELAAKDEMLAGFNHERARAAAEEEREEAALEGADW